MTDSEKQIYNEVLDVKKRVNYSTIAIGSAVIISTVLLYTLLSNALYHLNRLDDAI